MKEPNLAFPPMNLPYTMSVEKAAEAIRQFRPKTVYPYHYRSDDGTKAEFRQLKKPVGEGVEIRVWDWYGSGRASELDSRRVGKGGILKQQESPATPT